MPRPALSLWSRFKQRAKRLWPLRRGRGRSSPRLLPTINWRWVGRASIIVLVWGSVATIIGIGYYAYDLPDVHEIEGRNRRPAITVLAADGSRVARFGDYFATQLDSADLPPDLVQAVISVEDRRFFSHWGVDPWGLLRALYVNIRAGHLVQGGSTITQQLAKNLFLTPARTMRRKIQEMLLALWLEYDYSKEQILTAYLNRVYLGAGAYGMSAAAETYFDKSLERINLYEAALLAGLLKAPSRYAPTNDPEAARDRAAVVLGTMIDAGYITPAMRDKAMAGFAKSTPPATKYDGRYFATWIMEQAKDYAQTTGQDLVISTTLDPKLQRLAERNVVKLINEASRKKQNVTQAALLTLAPDGAVRAYVGGYDYDNSEFDRVTSARRQPGSAFKPFVYLAALQGGMNPESTVYDSPVDIGDYAPDNYQSKYFGETSLREALVRSLNAVAVKLVQQYGIEAVRRVARKLGINTPLGRDLSLALGTSEVSLYDLTTAYAAIANGGKTIVPYAIDEIRTRDPLREDKVIYRRNDIALPQATEPAATAQLVQMMQGVLTGAGTGVRAAIGRPAAGKTGTTQNYHDAWFVGFTADYVTGVWFGNDDNRPMRKVTGGLLPARLWHDYMLPAHAGLPERALPALENLPLWTARQPDFITERDSPAHSKNATSPLQSRNAPPVNVVDEVGGLINRLLGTP